MGLIRLAIILMGLSHSALATNSSLLSSIKSRLLQKTSLSGEFQQTKYIRQMETKLESSGRFTLDRKAGLMWGQIKPFAFTMTLSGDRMEMQKPGERSEVITRDQNPMVFGFAHTFLSLFSGDLSELNSQFTITAGGSEKNWTLEFLPNAELTKKAISKIVVHGAEVVKSVQVDDIQGNSMTISFSKVQPLK